MHKAVSLPGCLAPDKFSKLRDTHFLHPCCDAGGALDHRDSLNVGGFYIGRVEPGVSLWRAVAAYRAASNWRINPTMSNKNPHTVNGNVR
jgi:hypothetical protein